MYVEGSVWIKALADFWLTLGSVRLTRPDPAPSMDPPAEPKGGDISYIKPGVVWAAVAPEVS